MLLVSRVKLFISYNASLHLTAGQTCFIELTYVKVLTRPKKYVWENLSNQKVLLFDLNCNSVIG